MAAGGHFGFLASPRFGPHFREGHRGSILFKYLKVSESTLKPSSALGGHGRSKYDPTKALKTRLHLYDMLNL